MFVTIRSYNISDKADYIKYRFELVNIECKTEYENESYKVQVQNNQVEAAVDELLKIHTEYPNENFARIANPNELLRILIPIDFSDKSLEAAKYALDIATKRPVELKLLHVWNDEMSDSMAMRNSYMVEDFIRIQRNEQKNEISASLDIFSKKLHKLITETQTQKNLLYHFTIAEGSVSKQIEMTISHYKPHLVITGHNTDKKTKFRISREVVNGIIDLACCPVYYIPHKVSYIPFDILNIMYATNFHKHELESFNLITELAKGYNTHIHCLHVLQEGSLLEAEEKMLKLINNIKSETSLDAKIHGDILSNTKLLEGFNRFIEEKKIDMLAFTSPEYGVWHKLFNPDNLRNIMKGSSLPLLIFRHKD